MNEPKKRGRPSMADVAARKAKAMLEGDDAKTMRQAMADAEAVNVERAEQSSGTLGYANVSVCTTLSDVSQSYALRVWAGQSESADLAWRIQRVKEALEGQGLSFEGVQLP